MHKITYFNGAMWFVREYPADSLQAADGRRAVTGYGQGRKSNGTTGRLQVRAWGGHGPHKIR